MYPLLNKSDIASNNHVHVPIMRIVLTLFMFIYGQDFNKVFYIRFSIL